MNFILYIMQIHCKHLLNRYYCKSLKLLKPKSYNIFHSKLNKVILQQYLKSVERKTLEKMLTATEKKIIEETWGLLSSDLKGNGTKVFLRFFTDYPIYQKSFRSFANVPFDQLQENKRFQAHAFTVMNAIDGLVNQLDDPEILTEMLVRIGDNHGRRGITAQAFEEFESSFMGFLETALGKGWTDDVQSAWKMVVNLVITKCKEGLDQNE